MVNNVIAVVNYVIAAAPSPLNFVIADTCAVLPSLAAAIEEGVDRQRGQSVE